MTLPLLCSILITYQRKPVNAITEEEYGVPDEGWQLDVILECYQKEGSVADAVADIHDGYDPTPQTSYEFFH